MSFAGMSSEGPLARKVWAKHEESLRRQRKEQRLAKQRAEAERIDREQDEALLAAVRQHREDQNRADARAAAHKRWAEIVRRDVAEKHGLTLIDLDCFSRNRRVTKARQEAYYLIAAETTLSLPQIGRLFGGRDHTTILHGVRAHAERNGLKAPRGLSEQKFGRGEVSTKPLTKRVEAMLIEGPRLCRSDSDEVPFQ